jgi:hypothetical protein
MTFKVTLHQSKAESPGEIQLGTQALSGAVFLWKLWRRVCLEGHVSSSGMEEFHFAWYPFFLPGNSLPGSQPPSFLHLSLLHKSRLALEKQSLVEKKEGVRTQDWPQFTQSRVMKSNRPSLKSPTTVLTPKTTKIHNAVVKSQSSCVTRSQRTRPWAVCLLGRGRYSHIIGKET